MNSKEENVTWMNYIKIYWKFLLLALIYIYIYIYIYIMHNFRAIHFKMINPEFSSKPDVNVWMLIELPTPY